MDKLEHNRNIFLHTLHPVGVCIQGSLHPGGWADPLRDTWDTTRYGQQAGGTHPTGMHSYLDNVSSSYLFIYF